MHNELNSAPTSRSERPYDVELSEADYLAREVVDAKAALTHALNDVKTGLATSADLRRWIKHYPWAAVGASAVAGFATAAAVTPAPGESLKDKVSKLRPKDESVCGDGQESASRADTSAKTSAVFDKLVGSLFDIAKLLVQTLIVTTFRSPEPKEASTAATPESRATRTAK